MRYIARSFWEKGEPAQARDWYFRAIIEAPHLREPYMDLALMLYQQEEWEGVLYFTSCALAITARPRSYICEAAAWGSLPYDLRSIAFYNAGAAGRPWSRWKRPWSWSRRMTVCGTT